MKYYSYIELEKGLILVYSVVVIERVKNHLHRFFFVGVPLLTIVYVRNIVFWFKVFRKPVLLLGLEVSMIKRVWVTSTKLKIDEQVLNMQSCASALLTTLQSIRLVTEDHNKIK